MASNSTRPITTPIRDEQVVKEATANMAFAARLLAGIIAEHGPQFVSFEKLGEAALSATVVVRDADQGLIVELGE